MHRLRVFNDMTAPIIAPPGSLSAAFVLGERRGRTSTAPMVIGDTIPPTDAALLRENFGEVTETITAAYRDGHHAGRKQVGAA